jgi:hypothetical protein
MPPDFILVFPQYRDGERGFVHRQQVPVYVMRVFSNLNRASSVEHDRFSQFMFRIGYLRNTARVSSSLTICGFV